VADVTIPDGRLGPSPGTAVEEIQRGMDETFDRLASMLMS